MCRGQKKKTGDVSRLARMRFVVCHAGFEPATFRLKVGYSATELMARIRESAEGAANVWRDIFHILL